jgi:hypothetical protein
VNPLIIYGFSECYLRLSTNAYSVESNDLHNNLIHLCNHSIQKDNLCQLQEGMTSMLTQDEFNTMLNNKLEHMPSEQFDVINDKFHFGNSKNPFHDIIEPQIRSIAVDAVKSVREKLQRIGNGFEWLGLDLMVLENNLEVKLIEVNVSPDVSASTSVTERLVHEATYDLFTLILDENAIRHQYDEAIKDTEWLLNTSVKQVNRTDNTNGCNNRECCGDINTRIFSDSDENSESAFISSLPKSAKWIKWYEGEFEPFANLMEISRMKRKVAQLNHKHNPDGQSIVSDVITTMKDWQLYFDGIKNCLNEEENLIQYSNASFNGYDEDEI